MIVINTAEIKALNITPHQCVEWVREASMMKYRSKMPAKTAIHLDDSLDFFMTMPCMLPTEYGRFGCKNASRFSCSHPSVKSYLTLCDSNNGDFLALIDCDWITAMRTGAVAAMSILTLRKSDAKVYSFMGLGRAGMASLECLLDSTIGEKKEIRLLKYKDHAEKAISQMNNYGDVNFVVCDSVVDLVKGSDVLVSCITQATSFLVEDTDLFKPGFLLVPVHTRGFQNCDCIFDKIYGDDTAQISGFQHFKEFKRFNELSRVLLNEDAGRENDNERIIAYNIGLGLHDVFFAAKIEQLLNLRKWRRDL